MKGNVSHDLSPGDEQDRIIDRRIPSSSRRTPTSTSFASNIGFKSPTPARKSSMEDNDVVSHTPLGRRQPVKQLVDRFESGSRQQLHPEPAPKWPGFVKTSNKTRKTMDSSKESTEPAEGFKKLTSRAKVPTESAETEDPLTSTSPSSPARAEPTTPSSSTMVRAAYPVPRTASFNRELDDPDYALSVARHAETLRMPLTESVRRYGIPEDENSDRLWEERTEELIARQKSDQEKEALAELMGKLRNFGTGEAEDDHPKQKKTNAAKTEDKIRAGDAGPSHSTEKGKTKSSAKVVSAGLPPKKLAVSAPTKPVTDLAQPQPGGGDAENQHKRTPSEAKAYWANVRSALYISDDELDSDNAAAPAAPAGPAAPAARQSPMNLFKKDHGDHPTHGTTSAHHQRVDSGSSVYSGDNTSPAKSPPSWSSASHATMQTTRPSSEKTKTTASIATDKQAWDGERGEEMSTPKNSMESVASADRDSATLVEGNGGEGMWRGHKRRSTIEEKMSQVDEFLLRAEKQEQRRGE